MKLQGRLVPEDAGTEYRIFVSDQELSGVSPGLEKRLHTLFKPVDNKPPSLSAALQLLTDVAKELGY